jgi:hypothetical protein
MLNLKGTTKCPKCRASMNRQAALLVGESAAPVKSEYSARKLAANTAIYDPQSAPGGVLRGKQVPLSSAEARFKARCVVKGWKPHRPSWPDFLVESPKGFIAVEVKGKDDVVSLAQAMTFEMLTEAGIRVFVYQEEKGGTHRLYTWWDYIEAFRLTKAVQGLRGKPPKRPPLPPPSRKPDVEVVMLQPVYGDDGKIRAMQVGG